MDLYSNSFYETFRGPVRESAQEIVPLVMDLLHPRRVVDIGCGTGTWLAVFAEHGATEIVGVDGDYVDRSLLDIPSRQFVAADLNERLPLVGDYDLAVCLEVAEHLPERRAGPLVNELTSLAPAVLFSAAIPQQGGVNHVNEQWPEYWAAHFQNRGFVAVDCLRRLIWQNPKVAWFYTQNILVFAEERYARDHPRLTAELTRTNGHQLSLVHPSCFLVRIWEERDLANRPLKQILGVLPTVSKKAVRRRLGQRRTAQE